MPFPDYEEFIALLNEHRVRYLIIGAQALAYHARPRATKDLDIFIEPSARNATRLLAALREFFGVETNYTIEDVIDSRSIIQIGVAPVRIDLFSHVPGVGRFADAWEKRVNGRFGPVRTYVISLDDLIAAKEATNRLQDRADVRALKRARDKVSQSSKRK